MRSLKISNSSDKHWYRNGFRHRSKDLPAIEYGDGVVCWYKNGMRYEIIKYENGTKEWYDFVVCRNGFHRELHKSDGPAVQYSNGDVEYWLFGKRHRDDGPAVVIGNKQYWFINGEFQCTI